MTNAPPPLSEFIDLQDRRRHQRRGGFEAIGVEATVAVYPTKTPGKYSILTVRFSQDTAERLRLTEGMRFTCHIHPDQQHIALRPSSSKRAGACLFRPRGSRALVFQTTLRDGCMDSMPAGGAKAHASDGGAVVVSLSS